MAAQNELSFALFTSSDLDFLTDELFFSLVTFSILTNQINDTLMVSLVLLMSFAHALCNRYYTMQDGIRKLKAQWSRWSSSLVGNLFSSITRHCDIQTDLLIQHFAKGRPTEERIKFGVKRTTGWWFYTTGVKLALCNWRGGKQPLLTSSIFRCSSNSSAGKKNKSGTLFLNEAIN